MKQLLSLILAAVLLISAVPITASAAKESTVEEKFKRILDDYEFEQDYWGELPSRYYYQELAQYPEENPDWVLIQGGMDYSGFTQGDNVNTLLGNKFVYLERSCAPFKLSYGVYDVRSGAFYDLLDAWDMDFENLRDTWDALPPTRPEGKGGESASYLVRTYLMGDGDKDGELTILDATAIQRSLVRLYQGELGASFNTYFSKLNPPLRGVAVSRTADYDRDNDVTILDATKIQRHIAELPNMIDAKLAWDERYFPSYDDIPRQTAYLVNSLKELDLSDSWLAKDINNPDFDAEKKIRDAYDDDFFKDRSLLVLDKGLSSGSISLTFDNVSLDKDGVMNVNFSYFDPYDVNYPDDSNDRFIVIEVSKAFLDDVRDIKVNVTRIREKHYDYRIEWDIDDDLYTGRTMNSDLITAFDQLDPENEYHNKLITHFDDLTYPQDAFTEYAYMLVNLPLGSGSLNVDSVELNIDNDDILNIELVVYGPVFGNAAVNNRFVCIKLSKDWLSDSKDHRVAVRYDIEGYDPDTDYEYRAAKHPYLYVENPDEYDMENTSSAMLISDRSQLNPALKGHQTLLADYDSSFFRHHNILAIHYDLPSGSYAVQFNGVHTSNNYLYVDMLESAPRLATNDLKQIDLCVEIPSYYKYFKSNGIMINHNRVNDDDPVVSAVHLNDALSIPYRYGTDGYTEVPFTKPYSANLSNDNAFSPLLEDYRGSGVASSTGGVAAIINSPHEFSSFVMDEKLDYGYVDGYGILYEPCRNYQYDLHFFREYSLVAIAHHGSDYLNTLKINKLYKKNWTLYIDAEMVEPEQNAPLEADYISFVTVPKYYLNSIRAIKLCKRKSLPENLETVVGEITRSENREQMSKVILRSSSHTYLTIRNKWTPSGCDLSWDRTPLEDPMLNNGEGYVLLIKNHEDLEKYLPGFDKSEAGAGFNDLFFEENALIVMLGQGYDASAQAEMNHLCVINGDTLYLDASVSYQQQEINGTPVAQPTAPLCWKILSIKQSDVKDVKKIKVWSTKN